eukprot:m.283015 g.283015  ORF g.283015 m.283015 type:complete len:565 (+) comp19410_c1_seq1:371-2065(+)
MAALFPSSSSLCAVVVVGLLLATAHAVHDKPKAIVMLFVDDLGYGDTGFNGHPTTETPNIDTLAHGGRVLTNWYSGCPVCSGSRASLMTGRVFARIGVPGVYGPTVDNGLPLNETTAADIAKKAGYKTAAMGKWHLGQRKMYLPAARGFDEYLGIPYSDDMGEARLTACSEEEEQEQAETCSTSQRRRRNTWADNEAMYKEAGYLDEDSSKVPDPASKYLPLVRQTKLANGQINTTVVEQPLDFSHLADKYNSFVVDFINSAGDDPFFLYMPFSHVHTTEGNMDEEQYSGCNFRHYTKRGKFGDALVEADWIVGNVMTALKEKGIFNDTLILFTGDNGPWMIKGKSGGSEGLFTGRASGYWNTGKGSTWEGGVHEAGFAHWPKHIDPMSRSSEIVSSLDLVPTLASLLDVPLPTDREYDGQDMTPVLMGEKSKHEFLWLYGGAGKDKPAAVRWGEYKAHWVTGPGLGGCDGCKVEHYTVPLLFNIYEDPSEAYPLTSNTTKNLPANILSVVTTLQAAYDKQVATFHPTKEAPAPDGPGEGPGKYGVCCDRSKNCDCDGPPACTP